MERLMDIKNEYAKEKGFDDWDHFTYKMYKFQYEEHMDKVTERYAREVAQASLEKAAENSILKLTFGSVKIATSSTWRMPDGKLVELQKESITNPNNITLL